MRPETIDAPSPGTAESTILLLRWALIIATAYLVLFHRPISETPPLVALFVAVYLASNVAAGFLLRRIQATRLLLIGVVLFDTVAVSVALLLTQKVTSDFFLLYFVVMLIGTLTENLASVLIAALLISLVNLYTVGHFLGMDELLRSGHLVRIPFLFVVGLFFGHLVQRARKAELAAREALAERRAQTDFVAMLAHDLKSPLSSVLGFAEILRDRPPDDPDERREFMDGIESNAHQAVTLAMNFVDAFRLESGSLQLRLEKASLNEMVEQAVGSCLFAARGRGVRIETELADDLPDLPLDPRAFDRVVVNLLSNAIKFSPPHGAVRVETAAADGRVRLSVRDRGPGVPPEERHRLFQRFGRLQGSKRDSTGLGLFIVKTITEAMGGRVGVTFPTDGGSSFEVSFAPPETSRPLP
ncbi:MAG: HAMP domain-containing histidine kinase [Deltaproteobacteria bacterium]|nr:HAMP domain-containing histidine kinase [Deltaproteobacteria bacterium]